MPATIQARKAKSLPRKIAKPLRTTSVQELAAALTDPTPSPATISQEAIAISLGHLCRHPVNRQPKPEAIDSMVESLGQHGQLEALVVRELSPQHPHRGTTITGTKAGDKLFQILSGETRALASRRRGELRVVCRVVEDCDDAQALTLLATYNAERTDLDPIEKAQLIEQLSRTVADGGAGLTREAAAKIYGLNSGGGGSNLVRLLELPEVVQGLVRCGRLPQTFAREAIPYCASPAIVVALVEEVTGWDDDGPPSRQDFVSILQDLAVDHTESMRPASKQERGRELFRHTKVRLFEVPPDVDLGVVELRVWGGMQPRATNVTAWQELQEQERVRLAHKYRSKYESDIETATREVSPQETAAEQKALQQEQDEQRDNRVVRWRHTWLRSLIAEKLRQKVPDHWVLAKLVVWCLGQKWSFHAHNQLQVEEITRSVIGKKAGELSAVLTETNCTWQNVLEIVCQALVTEERNSDYPVWTAELVEQLATDLRIDLADAWLMLQSNGQRSERIETFLLLHNTRQLDALGKELGIGLSSGVSKAGKINIFLASSRILPFPKSIAPIGKKRSGR